ncbi:MAG TPA: sulfotransferase domain-containing protein [Ktedonobacteraceae bacterium]|nr:sulfotransferase domain-containing protein [Ktedonobacteraceae bacterium]
MGLTDTIRPSYKAVRKSYRLITSNVRLLPDFLIIGGQRCGTTSLYYYLTEQTGIARTLKKEVHFYDDHYAHGLRWYRAQFPTTFQKYYTERIRKQHFMTGESSPYYLFHPLVPERLAAVTPQAKLIILLRNPIDRAYSQHWLTTLEGDETLPFEEAIEREEERVAGEMEKLIASGKIGNDGYKSYKLRHYSYLTRGIYVDQIQRWMNFFPREQFLILKSEDLYGNPTAIVKQALEFLGLPESAARAGSQEFKQYREPNKKGYQNEQKPPKLKPEVRTRLVEYFKPHNARLYKFLDRDFGWDAL